MKTKLTLLALSLSAVACGSDEPGRVQSHGPPVEVTVSAPVLAPAMVTHAAQVTAERAANIATRMSGTVMAVHVDVGSRVAAGDRLATLDARDVTARVSAARAALELAEKSHGRIERLAAAGAASDQELDSSAARLEAARSALAEAQAQEAYAVVTAPFAGVGGWIPVTWRIRAPRCCPWWMPGRRTSSPSFLRHSWGSFPRERPWT